MTTFRLSVHPLGDSFHGRRDGGEPEWPPSPLRAFQALVAAAAARWRPAQFAEYAAPALRWLEGLGPPAVVAPAARPAAHPYRLYVPNNAGDVVAAAWARGDREASVAAHRTEKDVRPTRFGDGRAIHFDWPLTDDQRRAGEAHYPTLRAAARAVTHLGWGIDMVAADARVVGSDEADALDGHRWRPVVTGGVPLRVPRPGTLDELIAKHAAFLGRLSADGFRPVPPLSRFDVVRYHAATVPDVDPPRRPVAAFELHRTIADQEADPRASRFRPFDPVRGVATVAGMVRHAAAEVLGRAGKSDEWLAARVHGHGDGPDGRSTSDERLQFLPLPSLERRGDRAAHVGGVRRVLVVGWPGCEEVAALRRRLNGHELTEEGNPRPAAMLSHVPPSDAVFGRYLGTGRVWSTVTPVILPGHDDPDGLRRRLRAGPPAAEQRHLLDRLDRRVLRLLVRSFEQAGWSADAVSGAGIEYRVVGWYAGLAPATAYRLPPLAYPRYHVRVSFRRPVAGPLAIGAGRYRGHGVFACEGG